MAASKSGRNPAQKPSRVSRVPGMPKVKPLGRASPPPMNAQADRKENTARKAGPTRVGDSTPVPSRGARSSAPDLAPGIRDLSGSKTGMTIVQRANSRGRAKGVAG